MRTERLMEGKEENGKGRIQRVFIHQVLLSLQTFRILSIDKT